MTPTLRAELDRIEDFLMGPEGEELAAVLSALRGPDNSSLHDKCQTTTYIRARAFPRLAVSLGSCTASDVWSFVRLKPFRDNTDISLRFHFENHVHAAAVILGLKHGDTE